MLLPKSPFDKKKKTECSLIQQASALHTPGTKPRELAQVGETDLVLRMLAVWDPSADVCRC